LYAVIWNTVDVLISSISYSIRLATRIIWILHAYYATNRCRYRVSRSNDRRQTIVVVVTVAGRVSKVSNRYHRSGGTRERRGHCETLKCLNTCSFTVVCPPRAAHYCVFVWPKNRHRVIPRPEFDGDGVKMIACYVVRAVYFRFCTASCVSVCPRTYTWKSIFQKCRFRQPLSNVKGHGKTIRIQHICYVAVETYRNTPS